MAVLAAISWLLVIKNTPRLACGAGSVSCRYKSLSQCGDHDSLDGVQAILGFVKDDGCI